MIELRNIAKFNGSDKEIENITLEEETVSPLEKVGD
jgi:hypothetical protein